MVDKYQIAPKEDDDWSNYQTLIGPDGFECTITEPEDRNFHRDLAPLVDELNRLLEENKQWKRKVAGYSEGLWRANSLMYRG